MLKISRQLGYAAFQRNNGVLGCAVLLGGDSVPMETWNSKGSCENHLEEEKQGMS